MSKRNTHCFSVYPLFLALRALGCQFPSKPYFLLAQIRVHSVVFFIYYTTLDFILKRNAMGISLSHKFHHFSCETAERLTRYQIINIQIN